MYTLKKRLEISAAHKLANVFPANHKCAELHGHNWIIQIEIKVLKLGTNRMIIDFGELKKLFAKYDHCNLNNKIEYTTCENMCEVFVKEIAKLLEQQDTKWYTLAVEIQESGGNSVKYEISSK